MPQFVNVQNNYSLLDRTPEAEVIPACEKLGITLMPYFPLASGVLTGKYKRGEAAPEGTRLAAWGDRAKAMLSDERMDAVDRLAAYAKDHGHTLPELALSYLAEHADGRERHRRRDVAGAGAGERGRHGRVAAHRRRARRGGRARRTSAADA